jgi:hypothetical protein
MSDRRTSKISRLPKEFRDVINLMLQDGAAYLKIQQWLALKGHVITEKNISDWYKGGYEDWLKEQSRLADMKARREFAMDVVRENEGSKIHEAGLQIAATQIYELLSDFDVESLKEKLAGDPANFSKIVNALTKLSEGGLKYERYRAEVAAAKARIDAELGRAKGKGGITPETLEKIEQELRLL